MRNDHTGSAPSAEEGPPRFISFAQTLEDVVLWRALKSVQSGYYIDIGASDPDRDSVTRAFYERGWRGINVEPAPNVFQRLSARRPEDVNLQLLVGAAEGVSPFFLIDDESGFSTMSLDIARAHEQSGMACREISAHVTSLTDICSRYVGGPVHFLKIDVEGAEEEVLRGADLHKWRPWIIVVEATFPNTVDPSYASWEPILLERDYNYVYFDGLNRFYVAAEHFERLSPSFSRPPSPVLDWYTSAAEAEARDHVARLTQRNSGFINDAAAALRAKEFELKREAIQLAHQLRELSAHNETVVTSERTARATITELRQKEEVAESTIDELRQKTKVAEGTIAELRQKVEVAVRTIDEFRIQVEHLTQQTKSLSQRSSKAEEVCRALLSSSSWRLTAPLRRIVKLIRSEA